MLSHVNLHKISYIDNNGNIYIIVPLQQNCNGGLNSFVNIYYNTEQVKHKIFLQSELDVTKYDLKNNFAGLHKIET